MVAVTWLLFALAGLAIGYAIGSRLGVNYGAARGSDMMGAMVTVAARHIGKSRDMAEIFAYLHANRDDRDFTAGVMETLAAVTAAKTAARRASSRGKEQRADQ